MKNVWITKHAFNISVLILAKLNALVEEEPFARQLLTDLFANVQVNGEEILMWNVSNVCLKSVIQNN
jgi:hypothetical protein